MTPRLFTSTCIQRLTISLLLLFTVQVASAQLKFFRMQKDSVAIFRGFAVSVDLVGLGMLQLSDNGQYEGALRVNLHDEWFPIVEAGYGKANHEDDVMTGIRYKTGAPYFRIGIDRNLLRQKHRPFRLYAGLRYAFTSYKVDMSRDNFEEPVWHWDTGFGVVGEKCNYHWLEVVIGVDAKIVGPLHLGWSVRYKRRLAHNDGIMGKTWYVPGFGIYGGSRLGGTFNVIFDI
jgi:hypothetical protein